MGKLESQIKAIIKDSILYSMYVDAFGYEEGDKVLNEIMVKVKERLPEEE